MPTNIPEGSVFKGYVDYRVQELKTRTHTTNYRIPQWVTPEGKYLTGELPQEIQGWHFGPELRRHIYYQHHFNRVTQPKLHKDLRQMGIDISKGQINRILIETAKILEQEKKDILKSGLSNSEYTQADDTGGRHKSKNVYTTVIGNDDFAYYQTTDTKSRINFLEILRGDETFYTITQETIDYAKKQKLSEVIISLLTSHIGETFSDGESLQKFFVEYKIKQEKDVKAITEGALMGTLIKLGFLIDMPILSDAAGQFDLGDQALCWVHEIRHVRELVPIDEKDRQEINMILDLMWAYYHDLKAYIANPIPEQKALLSQKFDTIVTTNVAYAPLRKALAGTQKRKNKLLKVLDRPFIPLHNNASEQNLRDIVIKRKISGGSQSDWGKKARDIANTLIQTCYKQEISFWEFLLDRISMKNKIAKLSDLIRSKEKSRPSAASP